MKTEKQLAFMRIKRGADALKDLEEMDVVEVDMKEVYEKMEELENHDTIRFSPILKRGCVRYFYGDKEDTIVFILFDFKMQDNKEKYDAVFSLCVFSLLSMTFIWELEAKVTLPVIMPVSGFEFSLDEITSPECIIYDRQGNKRMFEKAKEEVTEQFQGMSICYNAVAPFIVIDHILQHPEIKEIDRKERKPSNSDKKLKSIANVDKSSFDRKEVILNGIKIVTSSSKVERKLKSKKREYSMDVWGVRGHYRHYKSGKVVFVEAYEKGKDRGKNKEKKGKVYRLKM